MSCGGYSGGLSGPASVFGGGDLEERRLSSKLGMAGPGVWRPIVGLPLAPCYLHTLEMIRVPARIAEKEKTRGWH